MVNTHFTGEEVVAMDKIPPSHSAPSHGKKRKSGSQRGRGGGKMDVCVCVCVYDGFTYGLLSSIACK